ncbi:stress response membrane protein YncL [Klebsiella pneumoniae]|uniref:Stress response membrane protein YncL n=1 Tax=Klebsiella pneumoniae TaxID=573 RepID=A0A939NI41_KLEPN|nr:stress response membrane protein YncL [Klebsiella pneumoniae]
MDVSSKTVVMINVCAAFALISLLSVDLAGFNHLIQQRNLKAAPKAAFTREQQSCYLAVGRRGLTARQLPY